jgi:hypothetical protein
MEAVMKRYLLVVLLASTPLFFGFQTAFSQADTDSRGNAVSGEALPEELMDLDIEDYYIGSEAEPVGLIQTVTGHVVVLHADTNEAYFAAEGDAIFTQDVFFTLEESRCRVKLSTEDVITMAEDSQISIDEFVDDRDMEKKESTISMLKGKAMFYVVPLFRYKDTSTSVETPTAVCGVRGTKFGVGVGMDTQTVVYGFEGDVEVYSPVDGTTQTVGEGQNLQLTGVGASDVRDTSHAMAEQFMLDTEAPALGEQETGKSEQGVGEQPESGEEEQGVGEEEGSSEEGAAEGEGSAEGEEGAEGKSPTEEGDAEHKEPGEGEEGPGGMVPGEGEEGPGGMMPGGEGWAPDKDKEGGPLYPPPIYVITDPIDPKDLDPIFNEPLPVDQWPIEHHGYFTGMLTMANGAKSFKHLYLSEQRQDCDTAIAQARDQLVGPPPIFLTVDGTQDHDDPFITDLEVQSDTIDPNAFPFTIHGEILGHNPFMEWGYWLQTQPMPGSSTAEYTFDNRGYYVFGDYTYDSRMSDLASNNVSGTYSGGACGTYWTDSGGANMSGNFSAHVNFASGSISNFHVGVSGGGHSVAIDGATGSFFGGSSQFWVDASTGTWKIDAYDGEAGKKEAYGSVYGPDGQAIGGVWKLDNDAQGAHATGMFHGKR